MNTYYPISGLGFLGKLAILLLIPVIFILALVGFALLFAGVAAMLTVIAMKIFWLQWRANRDKSSRPVVLNGEFQRLDRIQRIHIDRC